MYLEIYDKNLRKQKSTDTLLNKQNPKASIFLNGETRGIPTNIRKKVMMPTVSTTIQYRTGGIRDCN